MMNTDVTQAGSSGMELTPAADKAPPPKGPRVAYVSGAPITGHLLDMRNDRIAFHHRLARAGDITPLRLALFRVTVVSSGDLAHEVLVGQADSFVKSQGLSLFARPLLGNGLLTSERDFHKKQRRMMAPLFVQKRIATYADVMADRARASAERMRGGATVEITSEVMRTTLEIVGKTLFDAEVGFEASAVGEALTESMEQMMRSLTSFVPIPPAVPTLGNLRARRAVSRLDRTVYRLIDARRRSGEDRGDLLSLLLAARDEEGSSMDDAQVRDEAMTIFLAGHETTANAVAWALYLLARHPAIRAELEREVDHVLGKRAPTYDDLKSLPFTLQVLKEVMRLYPPAYVVGRRAIRPVSLLGYPIKKNGIVLVNIAGIHRRPDYFADPGRFDPNRFTPEREKALPRLAYMPFGAGPRICIGNHFALMEGQLLLATYAQHVRLDMEDDREVATEPMITLRPKGTLRARVTAR
jgi:cytochrome P450